MNARATTLIAAALVGAIGVAAVFDGAARIMVAFVTLVLLLAALARRGWSFDESSARNVEVNVAQLRALVLPALAIALGPLAAMVVGFSLGGLTPFGLVLAVGLAVVALLPFAGTTLTTLPDLSRMAASWDGAQRDMARLHARAALEEARFFDSHEATHAASGAYRRAALPLGIDTSPARSRILVEIEQSADAETVALIKDAFAGVGLDVTLVASARRVVSPQKPILRIETGLPGFMSHFVSRTDGWPYPELRFAQFVQNLWLARRQQLHEVVVDDRRGRIVVHVPAGPMTEVAAVELWRVDMSQLTSRRWGKVSMSFNPTAGWVIRSPDGSEVHAPVRPADGAALDTRHRLSRVTLGASAGAATILAVEPARSSSRQLTRVLILGNGFNCTPGPPFVRFGSTEATVLHCADRSLTVLAPPQPTGTVAVTVTNRGASPSNALEFRYGP